MVQRTPGSVVSGRYRLERLLGEGGMGEVWAAAHLVTKKLVALKVLKGENAAREDLVRRFFLEARAATAVQHPNVVQVHDVFVHDGIAVMVMDLLEGESLEDKLGRQRSLGLGELAAILVPVLSAVGTAHARGIVHRDLKPANIFLAQGSSGALEPKVLDFGIAKLSRLEADGALASLTETGSMLGTVHYMAPEQASGERGLDCRCDVWAMGVILYQCLSGRRPFDGDNFGQAFKAILTEEARPLSSLCPELPRAVTSLVARMLEKNRSLRCPDLREAFESMRAYADTGASSFGPPESSFGHSNPSQPGVRASGVPSPELLEHTRKDPFLKAPLAVPVLRVLGILGAVLVAALVWAAAERNRAQGAIERQQHEASPSPTAKEEIHASTPDTKEAAASASATDMAKAPGVPSISGDGLGSMASAQPRALTDPKRHETKRARAEPPQLEPRRLPGGILDEGKAPF